MVALTGLAAAQVPYYTINDLGTLPGGSSSYALGLNSQGEVVGQSASSSHPNSAFLWLPAPAYGLPAGMTDLGTLPGTANGRASAINSLGQVTGQSWNNPNTPSALLWLPTPAYGLSTGLNSIASGGSSTGYDIDDVGRVVGFTNGFPHAGVWQNQVWTDLGTLGGNTSSIQSINQIGELTGSSQVTGNLNYHAILWLPVNHYGLSSGVLHDLGTLGGGNSYATAINGSGQCVGFVEPSAGGHRAFLWLPAPAYNRAAGMQDLGGAPGLVTDANDIGDNGFVVGSAAGHAWLWTPAGSYDLNSMVPGNFGWQLLEAAVRINASGQICGYGLSPSGQRHGFLLTPSVAPPGTTSVYGSGCPAARPLALGYTGVPNLGQTFNVVLSAGPAAGTGFVVLSQTRFIPPVDLTAYRMPGCLLYETLDSLYTVVFTSSTASVPLAVPINPSLRGAVLFCQGAAADATANPAGLAASNGGQFVLGG
jgi:probable HAF family extracellular repeat protein